MTQIAESRSFSSKSLGEEFRGGDKSDRSSAIMI